MPGDLRQEIEDWLNSEHGPAALQKGHVRVERVLNWGGFVTSSFRANDGSRTVHLKLGRAPEQAQMRRCMAVRKRLQENYRAPRILAWVDMPNTDYGGLLFEHIEGKTWDVAAQPALLNDILCLLRKLHRDRELADALGDPPVSYCDTWEMRYRDLFVEDLRTVRESRPPFVSAAALAWMDAESSKVIAMARDHWAFAGVTHAPCHWDLWPDNVMVAEGGEWWLLDWDGLRVGDEAEDYATVIWPILKGNWQRWREILPQPVDAAFAARMEFHVRAITLDYAIDPLADWVDCDVPEWRDEVRARKQREHCTYLEMYRTAWG